MVNREKDRFEACFYTAPDGNDDWSGLLPEADSGKKDGPFATLKRARDAVREATALIRKTGGPSCGNISVVVRGGKYRFSEPLSLGPADGGLPDCPVTYQAYPGEEPVLSGSVKLTGWSSFSRDILRCELPGGLNGKLPRFRQLFFNGERQRRARWPKHEPGKPAGNGWAIVEGPAEEDSHSAFVYRKDSFRHDWAKPRQVEVNIFPYKGWCNCIVPVESIDVSTRIITLSHNVWDVRAVAPWYWSMPLSSGNRFFVENALEELDQPGEWCMDLDDGFVYFWPPEELTRDSEVDLPVLSCLINIEGASHLNISGLTFTETSTGDNMHRTGLDGYGAQLPTPGWEYVGEAVHLKDTGHVTIERNRFRGLGGNAVYLEGGSNRTAIRHNEVADVGANGICIVGTRNRHPIDNRVSDNEIHHCGVINKYVAGVFLGLSDGNLIDHNAIHHVPHHGVNLGSNGPGRNIVEYNDIRHSCMEIFDTGAINCWMDGLDPTGTYVLREAERAGHVIRFNCIAETWGITQDEEGRLSVGRNTRGIYLDDYTSNCFVYGNIIIGAVVGIQCHGGRNNVVENNFLIDCISCGLRVVDGCALYPAAGEMRNFMRGNRFSRNIVFSESSSSGLFAVGSRAPDPISYSDRNVYCVEKAEWAVRDELADSKGLPEQLTMADWQKLGFDIHTITGGPLFADPANGDFRLLPDSPAIELGILPIDQAMIGPRPQLPVEDQDSVPSL